MGCGGFRCSGVGSVRVLSLSRGSGLLGFGVFGGLRCDLISGVQGRAFRFRIFFIHNVKLKGPRALSPGL